MNENNVNEQAMQSNEKQNQPLFMDDFNDAVIKEEPDRVVEQKTELEPQLFSEPSSESQATNEVPVLNTISSQEEIKVPNEEVPVQQEEQEENEMKKDKNNSWTFIILLFVVVGVCVLLFPLLVKIFGY